MSTKAAKVSYKIIYISFHADENGFFDDTTDYCISLNKKTALSYGGPNLIELKVPKVVSHVFTAEAKLV